MPSCRKVMYTWLLWHFPGQEFDVAFELGSAGGTGRGAPGRWHPREARCEIRDQPLCCSSLSRQEHKTERAEKQNMKTLKNDGLGNTDIFKMEILHQFLGKEELQE